MPARAQWSPWDRPTRIEEGWPDLASQFAAPGRPAYAPDLELGASFPPVLAGIAWNAWALDDRRRATEGWPYPGVPMARMPIGWYDSVSVSLARDDAEAGTPFATVREWGRSPGRAGTRGVFGYRMGSSSIEGASMMLQRGDSARWAEVDLSTWSRSVTGPYGPAGQHRWGFQGRWSFGDQALTGAFAQRGAASRLESFEAQGARGESGHLTWTWSGEGRGASATVARAWDSHESFAPSLLYSVRDAGGWRGDVRGRLGDERYSAEARGVYEELDIRRSIDPEFDRTARSVSAGLDLRHAWPGNSLGLDLAIVRHGLTDRTAGLDTLAGGWEPDRVFVVPELSWRLGDRARFAQLTATSRATPLWADLAPDQIPFLQRTDAVGLEGAFQSVTGSRVGGRLAVGRTRDRAVVFRLPLEEQWLRLGAVRDPESYEFTLGSLEGEWHVRRFRLGGEGFLLARPSHPIQPDVDPDAGFRAWAETRFRLFLGDLGVVLRLDAAGVGERESESTTPIVVPGYVTFGATARLELGDALVTIRARNLEDRARIEPWIDLATGREARSPGLMIETSLTWTLFN